MDFITNLDFSILDFIYENMHTAFFDFLLPKITALGNAGFIWAAITIVMLCVRRWRKCGVMCALALVMCILVGNITLKPLIARTRPFDINTAVELLIARPTDFSFPSGHTMASFAASTAIFRCYKKAGVWLLVLASLIAFSRLYLYVHYPSDVIVGIVIGIALAYLSGRIVKALSFKRILRKIL